MNCPKCDTRLKVESIYRPKPHLAVRVRICEAPEGCGTRYPSIEVICPEVRGYGKSGYALAQRILDDEKAALESAINGRGDDVSLEAEPATGR